MRRRSSGPREPKNLADYSDVESAARGLEQFAKDLRGSQEGTLVKWDLNVRFWHPSWKPKPPVSDPALIQSVEEHLS